MPLQFEWDEPKRLSNIKKHGIDFYDAAMIFEGETIEAADDRQIYDEERIIAFGHADGGVLKVVYTMRGEAIRIISAHRANRNDREKYYAIAFPG